MTAPIICEFTHPCGPTAAKCADCPYKGTWIGCNCTNLFPHPPQHCTANHTVGGTTMKRVTIMSTGPAGDDGGQWDGDGVNTQDACNCGARPGTNHASNCAALQ